MVGVGEILTRGGVYLAKLNSPKSAEIGKVRPVVILTAQKILNVQPPHMMVCPLSSQSHPEFKNLHVELPPRDRLQKTSYALVEHCRSLSIQRLTFPRLAQLTKEELDHIGHRLRVLLDFA